MREAQRKGRVLTHPEDPQESEEEEEEEEEYVTSTQPQYSRYTNDYAAEQEYSPQRSPSRQEVRHNITFTLLKGLNLLIWHQRFFNYINNL